MKFGGLKVKRSQNTPEGKRVLRLWKISWFNEYKDRRRRRENVKFSYWVSWVSSLSSTSIFSRHSLQTQKGTAERRQPENPSISSFPEHTRSFPPWWKHKQRSTVSHRAASSDLSLLFGSTVKVGHLLHMQDYVCPVVTSEGHSNATLSQDVKILKIGRSRHTLMDQYWLK